jgi:hypothetical protein
MNSLQFYMTERHELEIKSRYLEIKPDQYRKQLIALEKKAEEMYQDEIEAAIIKNCATESTSAASSYGNGYEQGEMDFYKTMQGKGNQYADGYAEGYLRALELVKFQIVEQLEARR